MLQDSLISASYLLIGCGWSIHRSISHSRKHFSTILPESIFASVGIAAIGAKCLFNLGYNYFRRKYSIDPQLIKEGIKFQTNATYIIDSSLSVIGLASLIYSLYHHHSHQKTGAIVISSLTLAEIICIKGEGLKPQSQTSFSNDSTATNCLNKFVSIVDGCLKWLWILSSGLFGWKVKNYYAQLATIPCIISMLVYPSKSFYHEWSTKNCIMDYMMLIYIILMTEAICPTFSNLNK